MDTPPLPADPLLTDGDVLLRRHRDADLDGVLAQGSDPVTQRWVPVPVPYGPQQARDYLAAVRADHGAGRALALAVEVGGRFAGSVDLRLEGAGWAEVGYGLAPWARGRGVGVRALRLLLVWAFDEAGLTGVHWRALVGNEASRRTARACGVRVEGTVRGLLDHRGERRDGWIGSVLAGELVR
ncbi:GNAT family N-acetyltransferase [Kineococcus terrestris]|uniref:GNAT family N-acetyltransferase n=1 Tax=Kineococcus terrestris TaxID=2044856 RepID=UPI0034DB4517